MATDIDRAYYGWSHKEMSDGVESQGVTDSQVVDHGSVSFGRFALESLSWERRSVFTHNRRQEELEKINGLVAKKRAYFEERYKSIQPFKDPKKNQQTELMLDYGADGSISSQNGEEDETVPQHRSPKEQEGSIASPWLEDVKVETKSCTEIVESMPSVCEPTSPNVPHEISFSEESIKRIDHYESSNGDLHAIPIEIGPLLSPEKIKPVEKRFVDDGKGKVETLDLKVENGPLTATRALFRGTKDLAQINMQSAKKPQYSKPTPSSKGTATVLNGKVLDRVPKQNSIQASKGIKQTSQEIGSKAGNNQITCNKQNSQQVDTTPRSALVPSSTSLADPHPKITTPGLFTLVMQRRLSNRASAAALDSENSKKLVSTPSHSNSSSNMQDVRKKRTTVCRMIPKGGVESKRVVNNAIRKPLAADSKHTTSRSTEIQMLGLTKPRISSSCNLPARSTTVKKESQLCSSIVTKMAERGAIPVRQPQEVVAKSIRSSLNGTMKTGIKKPAEANYNGQSHTGSNPSLDSPLGRRRTRLEFQKCR